MDVTFFFFDGTNPKLGKFINPQITPAIFPIWIQKTLLGKTVQEENQTFFYNSPWNFQYFQLQMMDPSSSIPSNHPWMTIESPMEAKYINYLSLSLAFVLCLLSIDYWLLVSSFLFHFFFSFLYFIPMLDITFLLFCNFTTAKPFNDCSRKAVSFWGYPLPARCFIIVQDKKQSKQRRYLY